MIAKGKFANNTNAWNKNICKEIGAKTANAKGTNLPLIKEIPMSTSSPLNNGQK